MRLPETGEGEPLSTEELASIEACRALILEFAARIDNNLTHTLGELMTADATSARPTNPDVTIAGRDAILAAFALRPKTMITQHLNLNIRIRLTGRDTAEGQSVVMLFIANAADELVPGKGRKAGAPLLGTWTDSFVRTADGWRFSARHGATTIQT